MTVLGLVLIVIAALVFVAALFGGADDPAQLDLGWFNSSTSALGVFLIGAGTMLVFAAGVELLRRGVPRSARRRRELRHARAVVSEHERRDRSGGDAQDTATDPESGPEDGGGGTTR